MMYILSHMWMLEYLNLQMYVFNLECLQMSGTRKEPWGISREGRQNASGMEWEWGIINQKRLSVVGDEGARQKRKHEDGLLILKTFEKAIQKLTTIQIYIFLLYCMFYTYIPMCSTTFYIINNIVYIHKCSYP